MSRISEKELKKIRELDLFTYFYNYDSNELIQNGRNDYFTKSHGSLHLSNGLWMWWAKGIGGRSALDYLIKVEGWEFRKAALYINDLLDNHPPKKVNQISKQVYQFRMPYRAENNDIIINYLVNERRIDKKIVNYCIEKGIVYQSYKDNSVVFAGYDENDIARFATTRSTNDTWKKDVYGSDKRYSFSILNGGQSLHVFESAIDLLSYMTLLKMDNKDYLKNNYLSLSGISISQNKKNEYHLPIALEEYLLKHKQVKKIYLHFDNDETGKFATNLIINLLNNYNVYDYSSRKYKDINELLQHKVMFRGKKFKCCYNFFNMR